MKTQQELCDILGFIAEYATYQLGSGVHTSRVIRNAQRIGEALGVDVQLSSFQKSTICNCTPKVGHFWGVFYEI